MMTGTGIITFVKKVGERFAGAIRAVVKPELPKLYIERMAVRKTLRKAFENERIKDAARAAATAVKTEARARIAVKHYERSLSEQIEYGLGLSYTQRIKRRRLRQAQLKTIEAAASAKRTSKKRLRDYVAFLKKKTFKEHEWRRKWAKPAAQIRKEIMGREKASQEFNAMLKKLKAGKPEYRKGWYLFYCIGLCNHSLPCYSEEESFYWEQRVEKVSWYHVPKPDLEAERDRILGRGNYMWETKNWRLVWIH